MAHRLMCEARCLRWRRFEKCRRSECNKFEDTQRTQLRLLRSGAPPLTAGSPVSDGFQTSGDAAGIIFERSLPIVFDSCGVLSRKTAEIRLTSAALVNPQQNCINLERCFVGSIRLIA